MTIVFVNVHKLHSSSTNDKLTKVKNHESNLTFLQFNIEISSRKGYVRISINGLVIVYQIMMHMYPLLIVYTNLKNLLVRLKF